MALWRKDSPGQVSNQQTSTPGESLLWDLMPPTPQFPWLPLEAEGPGGPRPFHADAIWEQKLGAQAQAPRAWGKVSLIARSLTAPRAPTHCDALAGRQCRAGPRDYARTPCCVPWGCTARQACPCPPRSWASQTRGQDSSRECGRSREPREPARGLQVCAVCGGRAYELPSLRPAQRSALCSRQPDHLPLPTPHPCTGACVRRAAPVRRRDKALLPCSSLGAFLLDRIQEDILEERRFAARWAGFRSSCCCCENRPLTRVWVCPFAQILQRKPGLEPRWQPPGSESCRPRSQPGLLAPAELLGWGAEVEGPQGPTATPDPAGAAWPEPGRGRRSRAGRWPWPPGPLLWGLGGAARPAALSSVTFTALCPAGFWEPHRKTGSSAPRGARVSFTVLRSQWPSGRCATAAPGGLQAACHTSRLPTSESCLRGSPWGVQRPLTCL